MGLRAAFREGWRGLWSSTGSGSASAIYSGGVETEDDWETDGDSSDSDNEDSYKGNRRYQRLSESILKMRLPEQVFGVASPNPDAGTAFDDRLFVSLEKAAPLDLPPQVQQAAQRLSFFLTKKNVRAKRVIDLVTDFAWGEGPTFIAADPKVQELLDRHWKINQWESKGPERTKSLAIFGEQLYPWVGGKNGLVKITSVSPFKIIRVNRNPEDAEDLLSVTTTPLEDLGGLHGPHGPDGPADHSRDVAVDPKVTRDKKTFDIVKPNDETGELEGEAFYFAVNRVAGATRGVPDLTSAIDWLEGLDSFIFGLLERANITGNVVWDLEFKGARAPEIRKKLREFVRALRKNGGVWGHNEKAALNVKVPQLGSSDAEIAARILIRQIQAGTGLAGLFFGDAEDLSRASASELSIPVAKMIQGRQAFLKMMLSQIFTLQVEWAKKENKLEGVTDFSFEIQMPRIYLRDLDTIARATASISQSLILGVEQGWISNDEARVLYRGSLEQLGPLGAGIPTAPTGEQVESLSPVEEELVDVMSRVRRSSLSREDITRDLVSIFSKYDLDDNGHDK